MIDPHSAHNGASAVIGANGNSCCGLVSVGLNPPVSPTSVTAYSGPKNRAPSHRKM
jgi:hypothetical protein